ncbi:unnamed protein product, partial [marine sediment metagenome]
MLKPGYFDCVLLLVEAGADLLIRDGEKRTPLDHALARGENDPIWLYVKERIIKITYAYLHDKNPATRSIPRDMDLLNTLIAYGFEEEVAEFLAYTPDINSLRNYLEITPLYWAVSCGNSVIIEKLLVAGADPNLTQITKKYPKKDKWGFTPLMEAVVKNNVTNVHLLLKYQADIHVKDAHGKTAYDH